MNVAMNESVASQKRIRKLQKKVLLTIKESKWWTFVNIPVWIKHPGNTSELARTLFPVKVQIIKMKITHHRVIGDRYIQLLILALSISQSSIKF